MKRNCIFLFVTLCSLWACDIKPAEEPIANTGAANFTASFDIPSGMQALWEGSDKLLVIDSRNIPHRFDMDAGADKSDGEFSGTLSEDSQIKYVVYASDVDDVVYEPGSEGFTFVVPAVYTAKATDVLVKSNSAAIGTLQGSEVNLQSVCGFVKYTLEPNGKTIEQGGRTWSLTDLSQITITANDGKFLAGTVHARWNTDAAAPEFIDVEEGESSITFRPHMLSTPDGNIFYEAGDYYIPVIPQSYEDITVSVEDTDGNTATAVSHRALDVHIASQSNLSVIQWPTIVLEVSFLCASKAEEQSHVEIAALPTSGLSVDRVNNTTGEKVEGTFSKRTEYTFTEGGLEYSLWTDAGTGRTTTSVGGGQYAMCDLCFGFYNANWSYQSQQWTAGVPNSVSWIKFPAYDGILTKIEVCNYHTGVTGALSLSTEVDPETGIGNHDLYYTPKITGSYGSFLWDTFIVANMERGQQFYLCLESGNTWRIRGWRLYYKSFD